MRLGDAPFRINQIGDASGVFIVWRIAGVIEKTDLLLRIRDQRVREVELLGEGTTLFGRIEAAADDLSVESLVVFVKVPEPGPLFGSAGGVCLGEEPENDILSAVILQAKFAAERVPGGEVGSWVAGFQHRLFHSPGAEQVTQRAG